MPQALVAGLFCVMFALIGELSKARLGSQTLHIVGSVPVGY